VKRTTIFDEQGLAAFAEKLKEVRKARNETQESLSNKSGVTLSQIARIETVKINPSLSTIFALARALKVKPRDLFDFTLK
jgi:transcriptional regulator with XRE-family HTH domain